MEKICIFGANGQLGSYLCEFYLKKGCEVHGMIRRSSTINTERLKNIYKDPHETDSFKLHYGDLSDYGSIINFIADNKPEYCVNTAAQSHVKVSFEMPEYTSDITGTGVIRCLEAIRKFSPKTKFVQLSSSEIFGTSPPPQNESTPMIPASPYGCAKLFGYHCVRNYREAYGLWAANVISFNYESPRRLKTFVTAKIINGLIACKEGKQKKLYLGNLDARRDWISAHDVVKGIDMMLQSEKPDDYCLASGKSYSVRDFLDKVAQKLNIDWQDYVVIDHKYFRPQEVTWLEGSYEKINKALGWQPEWDLDMIINEMIEEEYKVNGYERFLGSK